MAKSYVCGHPSGTRAQGSLIKASDMKHSRQLQLKALTVVATITCAGIAVANDLRVVDLSPPHVVREVATLEFRVLGSGFRGDPVVSFLVANTDNSGGVMVKRVKRLNAQELSVLVAIDSAVVPGMFDVEVRDASGSRAKGKSVLFVEPYSWAARFGCTGAESWRRRIPCKRGTIY